MLIEYTKFYYHALTPEKQKIFLQIYNAIKAKAPSVDIHVDKRALSSKELYSIARDVYNDTPSFYYFDPKLIQWYEMSFGYRLLLKYMYSNENIARYDALIKKQIEDFKRYHIRPYMSDYEKEIAIHDYLVRNVSYDHEAAQKNNTDGRMIDEAYNVLGVFIKKRAVCWGIACAFKLLCNACELKSIVVIGKTNSQRDTNHAWNIVKLDEVAYHVDVTWDIKEKGDIAFCYDYFNMDDRLLRFDHGWDTSVYPKCEDIDENYYYKNDLFVKRLSDIVPFLKKKLAKGERYIALKFAATPMPEKDKIAKELQAAVFSPDLPLPPMRKFLYAINEKTHNIYLELQ